MKKIVSTQTVVWIATAVLIAGILILAAISRTVVVKNTSDAFNRQQLFLVRESARGVLELLRNIEATLKTSADLLQDYPPPKVLDAMLDNQQGLIRSFHMITPEGKILSSFPQDASGQLKNAPDLAAAIRNRSENFFITDIYPLDPEAPNRFSFIMGLPLKNSSSWLCCVPDFKAFKERAISPVRSGVTGYAWMINRQGILLAHPNENMEGRKAIDILKELWPEHASFNLETIINNNLIKDEEGSGEYTGWHMHEKKLTKKLVAYSPVNFKNLKWSICVSAPYFEVMAPLMKSLAGPIIFLFCFIAVILAGAILQVIQEKKKRLVNQELSWSNEAFDNISDGISIIDRNYRVLKVNRAVCEWQGNDEQFFKEKPCYQVFQQQESLCNGCPAKEVFETGKPAFRQRVSTTLGGKKYYFHLSAFPLKDETGKTVRVAECVRDVTREMELRSELIQGEQKSMIVKMSAQVAHEIRNPLGTLTLNIDLLEDEIDAYANTDTTEAKKRINIVKTETETLHKVLNEYLECTRFPTIKPEKHFINAILREMFTAMEEDFHQKQIESKLSLEYNLPPANVDQDQLKRAFLNIILNALESMGPGGVIEVGTAEKNGWIEITFTDNGPGIPAEHKEKIFTPFYTTKSNGTGLGLSITQHIVTEHKGEILFQNIPEKGAGFTIRIPAMQEEA